MKFFKNYALSLILVILFLLSWIGQFYTGWIEFKFEQQEHSQVGHIWGDDGYMWKFLSATFENWQSEFFQVFIFIVLTTYFIHKNSPQSRDTDDEMMSRIKNIESILENNLDR